jgi:hypothetical protein
MIGLCADQQEEKKKQQIDQHELDDLKSALGRGFLQPSDKSKRVKTAAANYTFTAAQAAEITKLSTLFVVEAVCALYPGMWFMIFNALLELFPRSSHLLLVHLCRKPECFAC